MTDVTFVTVADFFALLRKRPDLFPPTRIMKRGRLSKSSTYAMINPLRRAKLQADPKLSTLQRLVHGCESRLLVALPASAAPDLQQNTLLRD